jgi:hypothetical protein
MHPFGLITLPGFLWEHGISSLFIMALGLLLSVVFLCRGGQSNQDARASLPHFSLSYIMSSLKRRHDFFSWGFKVTNQRLFQFRLLRVCQTSFALISDGSNFLLTPAHPRGYRLKLLSSLGNKGGKIFLAQTGWTLRRASDFSPER